MGGKVEFVMMNAGWQDKMRRLGRMADAGGSYRSGVKKGSEQHGFTTEIEPLGGAYVTLMKMKITVLYCRPSQNLPYRIFRAIRNAVMIPVMNFMALHLDRVILNEKLCLNYAVIVRKQG